MSDLELYHGCVTNALLRTSNCGMETSNDQLVKGSQQLKPRKVIAFKLQWYSQNSRSFVGLHCSKMKHCSNMLLRMSLAVTEGHMTDLKVK